MAFVSLPEVQQWLEDSKLQIPSVDPLLEDTYREIVFAKVSPVYDTSGWDDEITTPSLIRKILSLYIAARIYKRAYSENSFTTDENYGEDLERLANELVMGIISGDIVLVSAPVVSLQQGGPGFWPDDTTGVLDPKQDIKFAMGTRF